MDLKTYAGETLEQWWKGGIISRLPFQATFTAESQAFLSRTGNWPPGLLLCMVFQPARGIGIKSLPLWPQRHRLLLIDLLGYGDSEKPVSHRYSLL